MPEARAFPSIPDDLPTDQDALGFAPYADALAGILTDPGTRTPLTLGVFGTWGSGKTSLMKMIEKRVLAEVDAEGKPRHRAISIWFNAWKYNREDALWRALLLALLDELARALPEDGKEREKQEKILDHLREPLYRDTTWTEKGRVEVDWGQAARAAAGAGFNLVVSGLGLGLVAEMVEEARKALGGGKTVGQAADFVGAFRRKEQAHHQAQLRSVEQFQTNFGELVKRLSTRPGDARRLVVVFVDDLDRCLAEKALQVLEALKLFLDVEGCVFVLGLDPEAIAETIRTRYRDEGKARDYLDKIVQLPFILPPIEEEAMQGYVNSLAPSLPDPRCAQVFASGLSANPRQVKRTIRTFLLLSRLVDAQPDLKKSIQPVLLAKMVAIQEAHPGFYELVRRRRVALIDLERYFREQDLPGRVGEGAVEKAPQLHESLAPFAANPDLRRLLMLFNDDNARDDACFEDLTPEGLKPYISLTRSATPLEAPASRVARLAFEPDMVSVPGGSFSMGTSDVQIEMLIAVPQWAKEAQSKGWFDREQPQHEVTVQAFEIGRFPVTNAEYAAFVEATGHEPPGHWRQGRAPEALVDHPVVNVSWRDAMDYVGWLAERTGRPYRLPTEAEWERAARGDDGRQWPWGNDWDAERANCKPAGPGATTPVGQYSPDGNSPFGAADMAGNVWEWCSTLYLDYPYARDAKHEDPEAGGRRVLRGGSWYNENPAIMRCAFRDRYDPAGGDDYRGFRVARGSLT